MSAVTELDNPLPPQITDTSKSVDKEEDADKGDVPSTKIFLEKKAENVSASKAGDGGDLARNAKKAVSKFFANPFQN